MTEATERLDTGLAAIFDSLLREVHTCMPGQVTALNRAAQTVSVRPCLQRKFKNADPADLPVIEDVPVVFPGAGDLWLVFDIPVDSYVLLVFSERAIAEWMEKGGSADPRRYRKFHLSDAIAIPGLLPKPIQFSGGIPSDEIALRHPDGTTYVKVDSGLNVVLNDGSESAIAYSRLKTAFDQLKSDFDNFVTVKYNAHAHTGVATGASTSAATTLPGSASTADMSPSESSTVKVP